MITLSQQILNLIQTRFPVEPRPYAALAATLGRREVDIINQIDKLKQAGIIRRIGAIFDGAHLGYVTTLVAAQVPEEKIDAFVAEVNALSGVSHHYRRRHAFNLWFTLAGRGQHQLDDIINGLREKYALRNIYSLPAERVFKIKVDFDFRAVDYLSATDVPSNKQTSPPLFSSSPPPSFSSSPLPAAISSSDLPTAIPSPPPVMSLDDCQKQIVRQLQEDIPLVSTPFQELGTRIGIERDVLLRQIKHWQSCGLIRRFGASLHHRRAGFLANGMAVFEIPAERLVAAGRLLARYRQVSHCYQRPSVPGWPYNLFAMTHCHDEDALQQLVAQMVTQVQPLRHDVLLSTVEYKKTNVKYFLE